VELSKVISQRELQQILLNTILRVQESENIRVIELIEEIKQEILSEKDKNEIYKL
jgi:hypothetical protein